MSEIQKVKIATIIENQIPSFLNEESPLFQEFLKEYYNSLEHRTGVYDIANNLVEYKNLSSYDNTLLDSPFVVSTVRGTLDSENLNVITGIDTTGITQGDIIDPIPSVVYSGTYVVSVNQNGVTISQPHLVVSGITTTNITFAAPYCKLTQDISAFDTVISVNSTLGFPEKYGLLKIDDEIITYKSKTETSFVDCSRGFSGIQNIEKSLNIEELEFTSTFASSHSKISSTTNTYTKIENLNTVFFKKLFEKFKYQFLPGFENRELYPKLNLQAILPKAKDFYTAKGTDLSYKILFSVLFGENVNIIKPQEYIFRTSDNLYLKTKNVLLEKISGDFDIDGSKGFTLYQNISTAEIASGAIYNIQQRPTNSGTLYEVSLDYSSVKSDFKVTNVTYTTEKQDSTTLNVDSTIGFPISGNLLIYNLDNQYLTTVSYKNKTSNQFLDISGSDLNQIDYNFKVVEDNFAYLYNFNQTLVKFRVLNLISDVDFSQTSNLRVNDIISLSGIGKNLNGNVHFDRWIYNPTTSHKIKSINKVSPTSWEIEFYDSIKFYGNDSIILIDPVNNTEEIYTISPKTQNIVTVSTSNDISNKKIAKKVIRKGSSKTIPEISKYISNVQNTYIDNKEENLYVMASGIPDYEIFSKIKSFYGATPTGTGTTTIIKTVDINGNSDKHYFYTGEQVYYDAKNSPNLGISTGTYFVKTYGPYPVSREISLSYNQYELFTNKFISVNLGVTTSGRFINNKHKNRAVASQRLFKKFNLNPVDINYQSLEKRSVDSKELGLFVNGVELHSPTLLDENIYYGPLDSVFVSNPGSNYDVITKPNVTLTDDTGTGAEVSLNLTGSFKEVKVISPGYNYPIKPNISVIGGNGVGAKLECNLVKSPIKSSFKADVNSITNSNTINFNSNHNFDFAEAVIYDSNSNTVLSPLVNNGTYYIGNVSSTTSLQLFNNPADALVGVNTITFVGVSSGTHYLISNTLRNTVNEVKVVDPGSGYSNKSVEIPSILSFNNIDNGINTFDNYIFAKNHNFKDGDEIVYQSSGTLISGLNTTTTYIATVIDENKFKLSDNIANYDNKNFLRFDSLGSGQHKFSYPKIQILISNNALVPNIISPVLEPIVLGSIDSVFIKTGGIKYGSSKIINYHRRSEIKIGKNTSNCQLKPIIQNGKIVDVIILNKGKGYDPVVDVVIQGDGIFADLRAIVVNGKIEDIQILNSGIGYTNSNTSLTVKNRGSGAKLISNIKEWKINQILKNEEFINPDDEGYLIQNNADETSTKFIHFYLPKIIRQKVNDNINLDGTENPTDESPIVGWAYDGNPIYGPYIKENGQIRRVTTSYSLKSTIPSTDIRPDFTNGFFVQDYEFINLNGDLDEYNGRFVVNKDFPDGTYAYHCVLDTNNKPQYPYVIGPTFKSDLVLDNFDPKVNQNIDLKKYNLIRNIAPYYMNRSNSYYDLIDNVTNKYKQNFIIKSIQKSGIDDIVIYNKGDNYKVNEIINFDPYDDIGTGNDSSAIITRVVGKGITSFNVGIATVDPIDFSFYGNNIIGITTFAHNLENGRIVSISGISSAKFSYLEGYKRIFVPTVSTGITTSLNPPSAPPVGIGTYIEVQSTLGFEPNDLIKIESPTQLNETALVTKVSPDDLRLYIERLTNINTGIHTAGITTVSILPRRFNITETNTSPSLIERELPLYFDPIDDIAYGNVNRAFTSVVGQPVNIPPQSIYLPNHNLNTGDAVVYSIGSVGIALSASDTFGGNTYNLSNNQILYAVNQGRDFIGLSTIGPVGIITVFFSSKQNYGFHSVTKVVPKITGTVKTYSIKVGTASTHDLKFNDSVKFNIDLKGNKNIKFKYNNTLNKITTDEVLFDSSQVGLGLTSKIYLQNHNFNNGDKVVYSVGTGTTIGGLEDNKSYYTLIEQNKFIKLCRYSSDVKVGTSISFTSVGVGIHSLSKINPHITSTENSNIIIDLSDSSLTDSELVLYKDINFINKLETYKIKRNSTPAGTAGASLILPITDDTPKEIYYRLINTSQTSNILKFSSDTDVIKRNQISIIKNNTNTAYPIIVTGEKSFEINLPYEPNYLSNTSLGTTSIQYDTDSLTALGPISKTQIIRSGKGYSKIPNIRAINTSFGVNSILKSKSKTIGKVLDIEVIKNDFDYPSDITLTPIFNTPSIINVTGNNRIGSILIVSGGNNYQVPPTLEVIGNSNIKLSAKLTNNVVTSCSIDQNINGGLTSPLPIVATKNSNGYDIDSIVVNGNIVTIEFLNDPILFPLFAPFPFSNGDKIFIENCRLTEATSTLDNFNSENYGYQFFTISSVNSNNLTITFDISGAKSNLNLGSYDNSKGYGIVVKETDIAKFEMILVDDLNFISNEIISNGSSSAKIMENGWDRQINQLRIENISGEFKNGDTITGNLSKINAVITNIEKFNVYGHYGSNNIKTIYVDDEVGFLNSDHQVLHDNYYHQKFSYSLQTKVPYDKWNEPVHSVLHPSGFKSFSNLEIVENPYPMITKPGKGSRDLLINIDSKSSMHTKYNFSLVTEDDLLPDGSSERILFPDGVSLKSYILNETNKVVTIDDISSEFNGTNDLQIINSTVGTFSSTDLTQVGIATLGLNINDYLDFSQYLTQSSTIITSIGDNSVTINIPHKVLSGVQTSNVIVRRKISSNSVVGISSFKLKNKGFPLFFNEFDSSGITSAVDLTNNRFKITNHNLQKGQKIYYNTNSGSPIGIVTTSALNHGNILMKVGVITGRTILENGYNNAITAPISGSSVVGFTSTQFYGLLPPYLNSSSSGIGTGARFTVVIGYSAGGNPISTSIILREGGYNYSIGDTITILGSSLSGTSPANNLSFNVTQLSPSKIPSASNLSYTNVPGINVIGIGSNSTFNAYRNSTGIVTSVLVNTQGDGYTINDVIRIAGNSIGGTTPNDDIFFSPTDLGTNILPSVLYVNESNLNDFKVSAYPSSELIELSSYGIGTHSFTVDDPNSNVTISIDNIIQSPLYNKKLTYNLSSNVGIGSTVIYVNIGINSLSAADLLKINSEILQITSLGIGASNEVGVLRGRLGTIVGVHSTNDNVSVMRGDYNIVKDVIYFTSPPYGGISYNQISNYINGNVVSSPIFIKSTFSGRAYSRSFDYSKTPEDRNIILDDISNEFTGGPTIIGNIVGIATSSSLGSIIGIVTTNLNVGDAVDQKPGVILPGTYITSLGIGSVTISKDHLNTVGSITTSFNFTRSSYRLTTNTQNVVGIFTNTNSSSNINNYPIILVNNLYQIPERDYIIDTPHQNTIKFVSGIPNSGKIIRLGIQTGIGYQPLVSAAATVSVSAAGTIDGIFINGFGSGYRSAPSIQLQSTVGTGALINATVGAGGTITALTIVNSGVGYTNSPLPIVNIDPPLPYGNINLSYITGISTGSGKDAKITIKVNSNTEINQYSVDNVGYGYKVGDLLEPVGIVTNPNYIGASPVRFTVLEVLNDKFSGYYPGQFIIFNDISSQFDGYRKKFRLYLTQNGIAQPISFKNKDANIDLNNNTFIFINDILQTPGESYTFNTSRIIFSEAPKPGSKCLISFYRGSNLDVSEVVVERTIKEGDIIKIDENINDKFDRPQDERVVKQIISSDSLDTFNYVGFGITSDQNKSRPLHWTKQTHDKIINNVLYAKSRPNLTSRPTPNATIIKNVGISDNEIYVDNAFPLFVSVDSLDEDNRNVSIYENIDKFSATGISSINRSFSSVESVSITGLGSGYTKNLPVVFSLSAVKIKDPIYNWTQSVGIPTTSNRKINSITYNTSYVSVGSSSFTAKSDDGITWYIAANPYSSNIEFKHVTFDDLDNFIICGTNGTIVKNTGLFNISGWFSYQLNSYTVNLLGQKVFVGISSYTSTLNSVKYVSFNQSLVCVGDNGGIFASVGYGKTYFEEVFNPLGNVNLNSVSNNSSTIVAVGSTGSILYSTNSLNWYQSTSGISNNLNDVVWDGNKFIAVGNNGTIITSTTGISNWSQINTNLVTNIRKIKYLNGFYLIINNSNELLYSFDLINWNNRKTNQVNNINDYILNDETSVIVGDSNSINYATSIYNRASGITSVSSGVVTSVVITNPGFGYYYNPPVIIESEKPVKETLYSIKSKGDYGSIIGIGTSNTSIDFILKSEVYDNVSLGIGYSSLNAFGITNSQLSVGDYFIINNSNVTSGYALTCIDLLTNTKVGTATSFIDGVYIVGKVTQPSSGIVTVTCYFETPGVNINLNVGVTSYYGNYSWGKIYDYESRNRKISKSFNVYVNNGLIGLQTSPKVYRTRPVI